MLISLIMLITKRNRRGKFEGGGSPHNGSSASGGGPPAAPALDPLDVAPGREAVRHLQDPNVVNPQETEKATEDLGHQKTLFPTALKYLS